MALFVPAAAVRGSVVLSPGRTEFIEKYFEVIAELQARGFVVLVHDWRGQGLSDRLHPDRLRGHAVDVGGFLADFQAVLDALAPRLPRPWINLSHSMGGALTTLAMAAGEARFAGALLSAPMFGLNTGRVPALAARGVAWTAARCGGRRAYVEARERSGVRLSHDAEREGRWRGQLEACPDLRLGRFTWGWLDTAFAVTGRLIRDPGLTRITTLVTVLAAGEEDLVDNRKMEAVTRRMPHARFRRIGGAHHELLMETDAVRDQLWAEFDALADAVTPPLGAAPPRLP